MPTYVSYDAAKIQILAKASARRRSELSQAEQSLVTPPASATTQHFFHTLLLERHLSLRQWRKVFNVLIRCGRRGDALYDEMRNEMRTMLGTVPLPPHLPASFRRRPIGPRCVGIRNLVFGRIQPFSRLVSAFAARFGQVNAIAAINLKHELDTFSVGSTACVDFPLGNYLMWSTFDEGGGSQDPFQPRGGTVAQFLCQMGLEHSTIAKGERFVVTAYRLPSGMIPHIPTVVEGHAGDENYYFRPLATDARLIPHTMPLAECKHLPGRAEVIHGVVFAKNLTERPARRGLGSTL